MRDLKFRAWDDSNKEMYQARTLTWDRALNYAEGQDEVMQFTSLLDKNGVEIYEGDIILYDNERRQPNEVIFSDGCFMTLFKESKEKHPFNMRHLDEYEVVGNTHQNPEMLK